MAISTIRRLTRLATIVAALSGCAAVQQATDFRTQANIEVAKVAAGPQAPPYRTITGFSDALRCMDHLMITYGVRDTPMLVEDLNDQTKKVNAGTRDMLISAISDLSKRSRAVRLVTFGVDSSNLANFLANADSKRPYETVPLYDIRGSITQLDEGLFKKQMEAGITYGPVGVGAAKSADASVLALDLSIISGRDYSVIPGVTARNSVLIYKEGSGVDGEAEYKKLGLNFGMTLTRSEGRAQALRGLVELAVIELIGKLTHTPYWSCLGANPSGEAVTTEIGDWFYSMSVHGELIPWMQNQLALRGVYSGPIDGERSEEFDLSVSRFRRHLGLSGEPTVDLDMFTSYLKTNHGSVVYSAIRPPVAAVSAPPSEPASLSITAQRTNFRPGETVQLTIAPSRDGHVACYLQDDKGKIQRFFPNRFAPQSRVERTKPLSIPGPMGFELLASERGLRETVACFATDADVAAKLPPEVYGTDFETLAVRSLSDVHEAFVRTTGGAIAKGEFHVETR